MDVLVSMGTNASYIYSLISMLHHHIMVSSICLVHGAQRGVLTSHQRCITATTYCSTYCAAPRPPFQLHFPSPCCLCFPPPSPQRHHINGAYKPTDFFETAAMLITLVLFGKYLESAVS